MGAKRRNVSRREFLSFLAASAASSSLAGTLRAKATQISVVAAPAAGSYVSNDPFYDSLYTANLQSDPATAKWVATTGSDSNPGTQTQPYLTIGKAIKSITGGGEVIIKSGTYTGTQNWVSSTQLTIPNGTAQKYTRIRAEQRFGVRIIMTGEPSGYEDGPVNLGPSTSYVWVDGLIVETKFVSPTGDGNDGFCFATNGTHNRLTRCIGKRNSCDQYGGIFWFGGAVNYTVLEDCIGFGSYRYMFQGGTGGGSSPAGKAVLRRCVGYGPFGPVREPTGVFSMYGSNDASYTQISDVLFANCYSIDSPHLPPKSNPDGLKWGDWYHPKCSQNLRHIGCGSINGGAEYGAFRTDNFGSATLKIAEYTDCFVAGFKNGSSTFAGGFSKADNGTIPANYCTVFQVPGPAFGDASMPGGNRLTANIVYPVQRVGGNGAEQKYAVGAFLTEFGQAGYDQVQKQMKLWPYPYESQMATIFAETISKVSQDVPANATQSQNPFAGKALGGQQHTFTSRVWEAAGSAMPDFSKVYV